MTAVCSLDLVGGSAGVVSDCVGCDGVLLDEADALLVNVAVGAEDDFVPFSPLSVQAESGSTVNRATRAMP